MNSIAKKMMTMVLTIFTIMIGLQLVACDNSENDPVDVDSNENNMVNENDTQSNEEEVDEVTISSGTLSVAFWDQNQRAGIQGVVDAFTAETGIQVEINLVPWGEYWTMLEASATGGDLPDIFMMHNNEIDRYMDADLLFDLTDMIHESTLMDFSRFPQTVTDVFSSNGRHFAIPHEISAGALWYNIDMFEEAGIDLPTSDWTWDDLYEAAVALTLDDGSQYGFSWGPGENQTGYWITIYSMGGYVINEDRTASGFNNPNTIRAMEFTENLIRNAMPPLTTITENSSEVLFGAGRIAMMTSGSWNVPTFAEIDFFSGNVGVALIPKDAETGNRVGMTNGNAWSIAANTDMPEEALRLLEWFATEEMQTRLAETGVTFTALSGTTQAWVDYHSTWDLSPYVEILEVSVNRPYSRNTTVWEFRSNDIWTRLWAGEISAQEASAEVYELMTNALTEE